MLLQDVARASAAIGATRSRNAKVEVVAGLLRTAAPGEVELVAAYLSGVLPQRRIGIGWHGLADPPAPAAEATLPLADADAALSRIAATSGPGSVDRRAALLAELLGRATAAEQRLLRGLISGELRQGAQDGVMLAAIARAAQVPEAEVRRAAMLAGFAAPVAVAALAGGADALAAVRLQVGRPVRPMLAASAPSVDAALEAMPTAVVECKLDGIRVQAHKAGADVWLFTRSLEEITDRLPEVVDVVRAVPADRVVLDGEVIALRPDGRPEPFQVTGARTASSADPAVLRERIPLTPWFFDVLHVDGVDLLDRPLAERHTRLVALLPPTAVVPHELVDDAGTARRLLQVWVGLGHEGVVVKDPVALYAAGRRGSGWVKVKPRHTLDLVVLAVERGSGRRRGFLSNIHLGARDPATGEFVMLGKTFKGMTDEMLGWQTKRFAELAVDPASVERGDWVVRLRPQQVVEVAFDGVQRSSRYPGGVALRFARVLRYRDDKAAGEADTIEAVRSFATWAPADEDS